MTLGANYVPVRQLGDGVAKNFSFDFDILQPEYLRVFLEVEGEQYEQEQGVDYNFEYNRSGGIVHFVIAPTIEQYVIIIRDTVEDQRVPFRTSDGFQAKIVEQLHVGEAWLNGTTIGTNDYMVNAFASGTLRYVSLDVYALKLLANGWVGVFGYDVDSGVCRLPTITNLAQWGVIPNDDGSNRNLGRVLVESTTSTDVNTYHRLYSDGWLEQNGYTAPHNQTIFNKDYRSTNYGVSITPQVGSNAASNWLAFFVNVKRVDGFDRNTAIINHGCFWETKKRHKRRIASSVLFKLWKNDGLPSWKAWIAYCLVELYQIMKGWK